MPRHRMLRFDFWLEEPIIVCSHSARLLFIGLANYADDNGVHPASYILAKAEVFPADSCSIDDIKQWINELIKNGLLFEYMIEEKAYWLISDWKRRQKIDRPTYKYPLPSSYLKEIQAIPRLESEITTPQLEDHSTKPRRVIDESSIVSVCNIREEEVRENKEREKDICEVKTSPRALSEDKQSGSNNVQEVFKYWQTALNHPRAKFDPKREGKIKRALKLGYTVEQLKQAIDGCKQTPYNMGENDQHQVHDDIELILRDASHIERFINHSINPPFVNTKMNGSADSLMAGVGYE